MGTPIAGKTHRVPVSTDKIPLSPDGYTTVGDLPGGGSGTQTLVIADDEDVVLAANPGTTVVLYTNISSPRTVTMPPAASGSMLVIVRDTSSAASDFRTITLISDPDVDDGIEASLIDAPNGEVANTNDGDQHWWSIFPIPPAAFPIGPFSDGINTYSIDVAGLYGGADGSINIAGHVNDSPDDRIAVQVSVAAGDSTLLVDAFGADGKTAHFDVGVNVDTPSSAAIVMDETEYIDISDTIPDGLVLRDAGGGRHLPDLPAADTHVAGELWDNGDGIVRRSHG